MKARVDIKSTALIWLFAGIAILPFVHTAWLSMRTRGEVDASYSYLERRMSDPEIERKIMIPPRPLRVALINSTIVSTICAITSVLLGAMAGYAFAKKKFPLKRLLFYLVVVTMAMPPVILMTPLFRMAVSLQLYDTLAILILPFSVTGFSIFYMRTVIATVPESMVDSARMDGLGDFGLVFRVIMPAVWPSVVVLGVLSFLMSWNMFVLPHALIGSSENYTISILLGRLMHDFVGLMWNDIMIVVIAAAVPALLLFLAFSNRIFKLFDTQEWLEQD